MNTTFNLLPTDPLMAERMLLRMVTDVYSVTPSWAGDGGVRAAIERDIRNLSAPVALGMSPEFTYWERIATNAGVVWQVSNDGYILVEG